MAVQARNVSGQDEPHTELAVAKFITMERFSIGPRFGIFTDASAEKSICAIADRSALAVAEAAAAAWADAENAAAADAIASAERLTEASALSGESMALICAEALAPAMRLMPAPCRLFNDARNAARAASIAGEKFNASCRLAMAFNDEAMALTPAEAERFTSSAAARLAIIASSALALADALTDADALAEAEAERAACRLAAAPGASRLTPRLALTVAMTERSADNEGKPGMLGTERLAKGNELSRFTKMANWAEAPGEARSIPRFASTCAITEATADNCAIADALTPRSRLASAEASADASALALALASSDATAEGPPIARLNCAITGGTVRGGSDTGGIALTIASML